MPDEMAQCRVCGKEYKMCRTVKTVRGAYDWRRVACSPECGAAYFAEIQRTRAAAEKKSKRLSTNTAAIKPKDSTNNVGKDVIQAIEEPTEETMKALDFPVPNSDEVEQES